MLQSITRAHKQFSFLHFVNVLFAVKDCFPVPDEEAVQSVTRSGRQDWKAGQEVDSFYHR
jgi:hypothetical protein